MSKSDYKCLRAAAEAWVENGGDSEGVAWCWSELKQVVEEIEEERSKANEPF